MELEVLARLGQPLSRHIRLQKEEHIPVMQQYVECSDANDFNSLKDTVYEELKDH